MKRKLLIALLCALPLIISQTQGLWVGSGIRLYGRLDEVKIEQDSVWTTIKIPAKYKMTVEDSSLVDFHWTFTDEEIKEYNKNR